MSDYNYGITCTNAKIAQRVQAFIEGLEIYQDGLDIADERVSVISKQGLLDELKAYASSENLQIDVEIWPADLEYDEAESEGVIERIIVKKTTGKRSQTSKAQNRYIAYAEESATVLALAAWLEDGRYPDLKITETSVSEEVAMPSIRFECKHDAIATQIEQEWDEKGVFVAKG